MSWREFVLARDGYIRKKAYEASHFRALGYITYCANTEKKDRKSLREFWPLSIDETQDEINGSDEGARLRKMMDDFKKGELYKK